MVIKSLYLIVLLTEALSAAAPAEFAVAWICDAAYVSETVTSHAKGLPRDQGSSVAPSGHLPSLLDNPMVLCWPVSVSSLLPSILGR